MRDEGRKEEKKTDGNRRGKRKCYATTAFHPVRSGLG